MNPKISKMIKELLTCPHCGSKSIVKNYSGNHNNFKVECEKDCQDWKDTWEEAINNWNKRKT